MTRTRETLCGEETEHRPSQDCGQTERERRDSLIPSYSYHEHAAMVGKDASTELLSLIHFLPCADYLMDTCPLPLPWSLFWCHTTRFSPHSFRNPFARGMQRMHAQNARALLKHKNCATDTKMYKLKRSLLSFFFPRLCSIKHPLSTRARQHKGADAREGDDWTADGQHEGKTGLHWEDTDC